MAVSAAVLLARRARLGRLDGAGGARARPSRAPAAAASLLAGAGGRAVARRPVARRRRRTRGFTARRRLGPLRLLARRGGPVRATHPLQGAGADNFAHDYARERRRREEPLYPHSIVLRHARADRAWWAARCSPASSARGRRRLRRPARTTRAARSRWPRSSPAAAWLAHASIDWLWELPAVAAPAMACLGLVAGLGRDGRRSPRRASRARLLAERSPPSPWRSPRPLPMRCRRSRRARSSARSRAWDADPAAALRGLERARDLNPLSDRRRRRSPARSRFAPAIARARAARSGRALGRDAQQLVRRRRSSRCSICATGGAAPALARLRAPAAEPARAGDRRARWTPRSGARRCRPGVAAAAVRADRARAARTPARRLPAGARARRGLRAEAGAVTRRRPIAAASAPAAVRRAGAAASRRARAASRRACARRSRSTASRRRWRSPSPAVPGSVCVLALALARYHAAVALGVAAAGRRAWSSRRPRTASSSS